MTKPIIVVKIPCKLLYNIQVKRFKVITSWPYLISKFLVACDHLQYCFLLASHFFTVRLFLFSIRITIVVLFFRLQYFKIFDLGLSQWVSGSSGHHDCDLVQLCVIACKEIYGLIGRAVCILLETLIATVFYYLSPYLSSVHYNVM